MTISKLIYELKDILLANGDIDVTVNNTSAQEEDEFDTTKAHVCVLDGKVLITDEATIDDLHENQ